MGCGDDPTAWAAVSSGDGVHGALIAIGRSILTLFENRPKVSYAIWRETLIDAAIFREAITNNSARSGPIRLAHLFCELFYRSRASGLVPGDVCYLSLSLPQLGETLGMSLASAVNAEAA